MELIYWKLLTNQQGIPILEAKAEQKYGKLGEGCLGGEASGTSMECSLLILWDV